MVTKRAIWCSAMVMSMILSATVAAAEADTEGWITLFNGNDFTGWQHGRQPGAEVKWTIEDGAMTNVAHGHDIATVDQFQDFELSIEWKTVPKGNSGVYLRGRIEVQVLDSYGVEKPDTGDNSGIYGQFAPKVNASKPVGEWNLLEAKIVGDEVTVKLNGQVVHDKQKLTDVTGGAVPGKLTDAGPLLLQGDHGKVWYRTIKLRPIKAEATSKPAGAKKKDE
ncbi:MAG: DUF1080 domain-containing protein [Candidatus Hydrogenedentes bacterium]|nr:DUF1080 domain-containing protein [Candidatus Hydrogenedentota bacterium]